MYTDTLTRIKNAQSAKKESLKVPFSNLDMAVLEILVKHGYILEAARKGRAPKRFIEIRLNYPEGRGAIEDVRFLSKYSRHVYRRARALRSSHDEHRLTILSTSKGLMTTKDARTAKLGGELLFEIW